MAGAHSLLVHLINTPCTSTGEPHAGQTVGAITSIESFVCSAIPVISGITSFERRINTRELILMSFLLISEMLDKVARDTVTPAKSTGSKTAIGFNLPVLDTCHRTSRRVVVTSSAGNLNAIAHFGNFSVKPYMSRKAVSFILITAPSIKKSSDGRTDKISSKP